MSQVIAIVNQKGGVAKTTTTVNLAAALSEHGEKVLCIDLDPQANLTMSLGCQTPDELPYTMADVIDQAIAENPIDPMQGVIHHPEGIDLMPSSIQLSGYETVLINEYGRENMLRQYVDAARPFYDHILIDCQPSLNILTINALVAADSVLIPTQPQFFSAKGLELLLCRCFWQSHLLHSSGEAVLCPRQRYAYRTHHHNGKSEYCKRCNAGREPRQDVRLY